MFATIRRYESVDASRTSELIKKVDEGLAPKLGELPGFGGYYVVDAGDGILTSIGVFDNAEHAEKSTHVAANWLREEQLDKVLPNPPKITSGEVVVEKTAELVQA
jgi:hypothetical protein